MDQNQGMWLEGAVSRVCWMQNTNIMVSCYNPITVLTGNSVVIPGIFTGNIASESRFEEEAVRETM